MSKILRSCDNCGKEYHSDSRNFNRGWGLCCSKSCAAKKREKDKPGYDPERVISNNIKRANWNNHELSDLIEMGLGDYDPGDSEYWDNKEFI